MPRQEQPLDPGDDVLTQFAAGLRGLRERAGSPTYRELGQRAHYSASTLSDAAGGKKFPTLPVALGYVRACGGDVDSWQEKWHQAAAALAADPAAPEPDERCPYVGLAAFQPEDAEWFF